jgi:hypothetical protein
MTRLKMIAIGAAALLAVCLGWAGPAAAQESGSFDIHAFTCPVEYTGLDYLNDCSPTAGVGVHVDGTDSNFTTAGMTDDSGLAHVPFMNPGNYTITIDVPGDFATFVTTCSTPGYVEPLQLTNPNTNQIGVTMSEGEAITCAFYIIPDNAKGEGASLPDTGVGPASSSGDAWLPLALLAAAFGLGGLALRRAER